MVYIGQTDGQLEKGRANGVGQVLLKFSLFDARSAFKQFKFIKIGWFCRNKQIKK